MLIVTSARDFIDIDGYASCIAYAELLQKTGQRAQAVSTATLNESIPPTVRSWGAPLLHNYGPSAEDRFALVDLSDPERADQIVPLERVDEVIDHRVGFQEYWQSRLGNHAQIEQVGATCTQIYERWKAADLVKGMSQLSARLLVCGILNNTLNFGADVTTDRDHKAYKALIPIANLPADWTAQYFGECQAAILQDIERAIMGDTKVLSFQTFKQPITIGQFTVWDASELLTRHQETIADALFGVSIDWFMNIISIGESKSYFLSSNPAIRQWLNDLLGVEFNDSLATADRMWLRKEVIKQDRDRTAVDSAISL